jgi:hypothetical protein
MVDMRNEVKKSRFLRKQDVGVDGNVATIAKTEKVNVAEPGKPEDMRWAVWFNESKKPLVLNSANCESIIAIAGSADGDSWVGKKIHLYEDPTISFAGKVTGGIRVKPVSAKAKPAKIQPPVEPSEEETDSTKMF